METIFSDVERRGLVEFAEFTGERVYMLEFDPQRRLPSNLARWQLTVDAMLDGVDAPGLAYLMIDQRMVPAGESHRRPGVHVDGRWNPRAQQYGGGTGYGFTAGEPEGLILATDLLGSMAYCGEVQGLPGPGGDCSHLDLSNLYRVPLRPDFVWAGDSLRMLHASLPLPCDSLRTVVRINVPGWVPAGVLACAPTP